MCISACPPSTLEAKGARCLSSGVSPKLIMSMSTRGPSPLNQNYDRTNSEKSQVLIYKNLIRRSSFPTTAVEIVAKTLHIKHGAEHHLWAQAKKCNQDHSLQYTETLPFPSIVPELLLKVCYKTWLGKPRPASMPRLDPRLTLDPFLLSCNCIVTAVRFTPPPLFPLRRLVDVKTATTVADPMLQRVLRSSSQA